jgi:lipopolysaccharide transport system permease protein
MQHSIRSAGRAAAAAVEQLYRSRELIEVLVARELKIRYHGTALGFLWSFLNPLIFMSVYVILFSVYMRLPVEHYPAFVLTGLLPWLWFSGSLGDATACIIVNGSLVKKVRLPAEVFPLVSIGAHLVHFLLSVPILFIFLLTFGIRPGWSVLWLPAVLAVQFLVTFGLALMSSALAVRFRDLLQVLPNVLTVWLFLTPIFYPPALVPDAFKPLLVVNPMAHIAGAYHRIFLEGAAPDPGGVLAVGVLGLALCALGHLVFEANQDVFAAEV